MEKIGSFHHDEEGSLVVKREIHELFCSTEPWEVMINAIYIFHTDEGFFLYLHPTENKTELWKSDDPLEFFPSLIKVCMDKEMYEHAFAKFKKNSLRFSISVPEPEW